MDIFKFWIEIPLALGTVGGLTALHPMAKLSLDMLQKPSARTLMQIMATAGLAQNFAALRALTTKGIQHGHMKMHLQNILNQFNATDEEKSIITAFFDKRTVTHSAVVDKIDSLREPTINWINFLDKNLVRSKLSMLKEEAKPVFGKMNGQQMIEHLSFLLQISNGKVAADYYVSDEKTARRKPFLNTEGELQVGFKAPMLSEEPNELKFHSVGEAINDLFIQLDHFNLHFETAKAENHPFFGELDYDYWKKFHVKHFTHHFKQFSLI